MDNNIINLFIEKELKEAIDTDGKVSVFKIADIYLDEFYKEKDDGTENFLEFLFREYDYDNIKRMYLSSAVSLLNNYADLLQKEYCKMYFDCDKMMNYSKEVQHYANLINSFVDKYCNKAEKKEVKSIVKEKAELSNELEQDNEIYEVLDNSSIDKDLIYPKDPVVKRRVNKILEYDKQGLSIKEICKKMKLSETTIRKWLRFKYVKN